MKLAELLANVAVADVRGDPADVEVVDVTHDARAVSPGMLFCCVPGRRADGHDFATDAVARGATALLCERPVAVDAPQLVVPDVRAAMGPVAAAVHGNPAHRLTMLGVTGTNGKTTTVQFLVAVLEAAGRRVEQIGTLRPAAPGGPPNTPDAPDLQRLLAQMVARGTDAVCMEVSSHALAQHRVAGLTYDVAGFTNLTQDHLDFHGTMEEYFRAKARLFEPGQSKAGVVNRDDEAGRRLLASAAIPMRPFSNDDASDLEVGAASSTFRWHDVTVHIGVGGAFNVSNALCAATMALELGMAPADIATGLAATPPPAGRFETVDEGQPFTVLVDYAHTPDGLEQALKAVRTTAAGRVVVVFGCGGEKDRAKRPIMGAIAARLADVVVVTSDNPRGEDPDVIIAEVLAGIDGRPVVEPDRRQAIAAAFEQAGPGDVVLIAGKGHETGQEIAGVVHPFDDRQVARQLLTQGAGG